MENIPAYADFRISAYLIHNERRIALSQTAQLLRTAFCKKDVDIGISPHGGGIKGISFISPFITPDFQQRRSPADAKLLDCYWHTNSRW